MTPPLWSPLCDMPPFPASGYAPLADRLARLLGTRHDVLLIQAEAAVALEAAARSLGRGLRVLNLVTSLYGRWFGAWLRHAGAQVEELVPPPGRPVTLAAVRNALGRQRFDLVALVHAESACGILNPLREIAAAAREAGALVLADVVASLGGHAVEMDAWGIDVAVLGPQKALGGPAGVSAIALSPAAWARVVPAGAAPSILSLADQRALWLEQGRGALPGTPSPLEFHALEAALQRVEAEGLQALIARHAQAASAARAGALALTGHAWVPPAQASALVTAAALPEGLEAAQVLAAAQPGHALSAGVGPGGERLIRLTHTGPRATLATMLDDLAALSAALRRCGWHADTAGALAAAVAAFEAAQAGAPHGGRDGAAALGATAVKDANAGSEPPPRAGQLREAPASAAPSAGRTTSAALSEPVAASAPLPEGTTLAQAGRPAPGSSPGAGAKPALFAEGQSEPGTAHASAAARQPLSGADSFEAALAAAHSAAVSEGPHSEAADSGAAPRIDPSSPGKQRKAGGGTPPAAAGAGSSTGHVTDPVARRGDTRPPTAAPAPSSQATGTATVLPRLPQPEVILFDLDDTLLNSYRTPERTWAAIIAEHADALGEHDSGWVTAEVLARVFAFLADAEGARLWRLEGDATRRRVVRSAFHRLNLARPAGTAPLHGVDADRIADRFETWLEETITLKPRVHETLAALAGAGVRLGMLTNGSGWRQRGKLARFDLARYFEVIRIEGEVGLGKPHASAFLRVMEMMKVTPGRCWMVGDDAGHDIEPATRLGLSAVQVCEEREAASPAAAARITAPAELVPLLAAASG